MPFEVELVVVHDWLFVQVPEKIVDTGVTEILSSSGVTLGFAELKSTAKSNVPAENPPAEFHCAWVRDCNVELPIP